MLDDPADSLRWLLTAGGDHALISRKPLGDRDAVVNRLAASLPGLAVDEAGKGTGKRGKAELGVQLVGDPVRAIELTLQPEHETLFRPVLERVATSAGWQLVDPDRGEILFPLPVPDSPGSPIARIVTVVLIIAAVAGLGWWLATRSTDDGSVAARSSQRAAAEAAEAAAVSPGGPARRPAPGAAPGGVPAISLDEFMAQSRQAGDIIRRQRSLAPAFRGMRVVNDILVVHQAELEFLSTVGNGLYVDPAVLADPSKSPGPNAPGLPPQFANPMRGGYRFSFTGSREGKPFFEQYNPSYHSFVYLATPALGEPSGYTFALISETGHVHYSTDGHIPTATDPSVTDSVAVEAPEVMKDIEPAKHETGVMARLRAFINSFFRSKPMRDAQIAFHEDRAIRDLRAFATAQTAVLAVFTGQGYASPEVLVEPSILPGAPAMAPFLDRSFTQEVREGYRFSFAGESPAGGSGKATLYGDYTYAATPVGSVPPGRCSFAIFSDGVIRVRMAGAPPRKSDPILGSEK